MRRSFVLLFLALLGAAPAPKSAKIHFAFAPTSGREVTQHLTTHSVTRIVGDPTVRDLAQESVTRVRYEKLADGWKLVATPVSSKTTRNGIETPDPLSRAIAGHAVVMTLGPNAEVREVKGYDEIVQAMKDSLPENVRAAMASSLDPAAMARRDQHDFESRYTEWAGLDVADGDELDQSDDFTLPTGVTLHFHSRTHVGPVETRGGRRVVTIRSVYHSDSLAVAGLMQGILKGLSTAGLFDSLQIGSTGIAGTVLRVVDPATLDILSEQVTREMHMRMNVPGRGEADVVRTEERTYRFEGLEAPKK